MVTKPSADLKMKNGHDLGVIGNPMLIMKAHVNGTFIIAPSTAFKGRSENDGMRKAAPSGSSSWSYWSRLF